MGYPLLGCHSWFFSCRLSCVSAKYASYFFFFLFLGLLLRTGYWTVQPQTAPVLFRSLYSGGFEQDRIHFIILPLFTQTPGRKGGLSVDATIFLPRLVVGKISPLTSRKMPLQSRGENSRGNPRLEKNPALR